MTYMMEILVSTNSGKGMLPDSTKPLPKPMLTDHQWDPLAFTLHVLRYREFIVGAAMWNRVHLVNSSEFAFQKSWAIASDFCGIQTHEGKLCSARAPVIDSISSTMFFSCDNFTKTSEVILKSSEITVRGQKSQLKKIFTGIPMLSIWKLQLWFAMVNTLGDPFHLMVPILDYPYYTFGRYQAYVLPMISGSMPTRLFQCLYNSSPLRSR